MQKILLALWIYPVKMTGSALVFLPLDLNGYTIICEPAEFIVSLVDLVGRHGCTMEDIFALFHAQDQPVEIQEIKNGEFDYRIRFLEGDDPYYYCFKDEEIHIIYHRFLPEDYEDFNF